MDLALAERGVAGGTQRLIQWSERVVREDSEDYVPSGWRTARKAGTRGIGSERADGAPSGDGLASIETDKRVEFIPARKLDHGRLMRDAEDFQADLLTQVRARVHTLHYSKRTEQAYVGWIRRFVIANGRRHPRHLGGEEVEAFLTHLASTGQVSASTQNQALAALLFLYRDILKQDLPWMDKIVRAKRSRRIPVVLSLDEL